MMEMWDKEPDARITSGCARDRMQHILEAIVRYHKIKEINNTNDSFEHCCSIIQNIHSNSSSNSKIFKSINTNLMLTSANVNNSFSYFDTSANSKLITKTHNNNQYFVLT